MPGPDPAISNLADTILRLTRSEGPMLWAVGKLRVPTQSGPTRAGLVFIQDILDEELPLPRSAWASPFISQFTATPLLNGRRALVLFVNAQPILLCTIGD